MKPTASVDAVTADMGEIGSILWARGWAERNAGNLSVDVTDDAGPQPDDLRAFPREDEIITDPELAGRVFLVTAGGARLRDIQQHPKSTLLLVRVEDGLDGYRVLWGRHGHSRRATSEFVSHLKIHGFLRRRGLPQKAVLHTHPTHLIALTHIRRFCDEKALNRLLWSMHPEVKVVLPEGAGFAPYRLPGTESLADATLDAFLTHRVALWEKHGCVAVGNDIREAFDLIETLNKSATIYFVCRGAGEEPEGLSDEQLHELETAFAGWKSPS